MAAWGRKTRKRNAKAEGARRTLQHATHSIDMKHPTQQQHCQLNSTTCCLPAYYQLYLQCEGEATQLSAKVLNHVSALWGCGGWGVLGRRCFERGGKGEG